MRRTTFSFLRHTALLLGAAAVAAGCWSAEPTTGTSRYEPPPGSGVGGGGTPPQGLTWSTMLTGTKRALTAVWGTGPANVYAVGLEGTILHFDGLAWSRQDVGDDFTSFYGVWASSASDVFVVGGGGRILHFDGLSWSVMATPTAEDLRGVWGRSPSDVWAVGTNGAILHFDGGTWSAVPSPTSQHLRGVWGNATDVWAVGAFQTILHFDGTSWTVVSGPNPAGLDYTAVSGLGDSATFVVGYGSTLLSRSGSTWSTLSRDGTLSFESLWPRAADDIFAIGAFDGVFHWDGRQWTPAQNAPAVALSSIWGTGSELFAVGPDGVALHGAP